MLWNSQLAIAFSGAIFVVESYLRPEIRMRRRLNLRHLRRLPRRTTRKTHMISRLLLNTMSRFNLLWIDSEFPSENVHNEHADSMGGLGVFGE